MKIKLGELLNAAESLNKLFIADLPIKLSYKLSKIVNSINGELKIYDEKRNELIRKLGTEDEKTKQWSVAPGSANMPEFMKKMNELLDAETEVIDWKIPLADLEKEPTLKLSAVDLVNISKFLEESPEVSEKPVAKKSKSKSSEE